MGSFQLAVVPAWVPVQSECLTSVATMTAAPFRFADLFAGVGGFHAALSAFGGECAYAVEIDPRAAEVYRRNWGYDPLGDVTLDANDDVMLVPEHDILVAGFPCQPFSKSGAQRGMDETRGTLYWNILKIIEAHHPKVIVLENVRNLVGPRHRHEWAVIIETLRAEGYWVSERPAILSPHLLPQDLGGRPQVRERVFITATWIPPELRDDPRLEFEPEPVASPARAIGGWNPADWDIADFLDDETVIPSCELTQDEVRWISAWDDFVKMLRPRMAGRHLPGHPIWAEAWNDFTCRGRPIDWSRGARHVPVLKASDVPEVDRTLPEWKQSHLRRNYDLFLRHHEVIIPWAREVGLFTDAFPPSRRKLEWQAQYQDSMWNTVMQLRPSGIRAKAPNYLPALVAITQTSIYGPGRRRLSPLETATLQGLPPTFSFAGQAPSATYKQMGNGVNVGAVWFVLREHVRRDEWLLKHTDAGQRIISAVLDAPDSPDEVLKYHRPA